MGEGDGFVRDVPGCQSDGGAVSDERGAHPVADEAAQSDSDLFVLAEHDSPFMPVPFVGIGAGVVGCVITPCFSL